MKMIMKSEVPEGDYRGKLIGVEAFNENADKYGPAIRFQFEIIGGEWSGQEVTRICGAKLTKRTALGRLLRGLKGAVIEAGEQVDPEEFVGRTYLMSLEETDSGSTRVESVMTPQQVEEGVSTKNDGIPF